MKEHELKYLPQEMLEKTICLKELGIDEYGWSVPDVKVVFECLQMEHVAVVGGDVYYLLKSGEIEPAYANWHCEPEQESNQEFIKRSIAYSIEYVNSIIPDNGKTIIIAPVIGLLC